MHACNTSTTKKNLAMSYYDNDYSDDMYDRYMHTGEGAEYFEEESPCEYIPPRRRYYKVSSGKHSNEIYAKDLTERKVLQADVLFSCW